METASTLGIRRRDEVATLVRRYRRSRGLTQEALAEQAGVSVGAISYLERGLTQSPHRDTLRALAEALSLSEKEIASLERAARPASLALEEDAEPSDRNNMALFSESGIPEPLTALIGREREVAALAETLVDQHVRLLTLTGPAGVGKTRLAAHAAKCVWSEQQRPVVYVGLTTVQDPERVLVAIAQALEIQDTGVLPLRDSLRIALADRELLLVLDNFEQVTAAARTIVDLLGACPGLTALVTSRTALNVRGEREFPVPPLGLPTERSVTETMDLERYSSVALFLERARAVRPNFAVETPEDVKQMVEVCARLDGLPLAIELAAAQLRHASLAELHRRLSSEAPLNALAGGAQDLPDHQRTMRAAIAWSYSLLVPEEQRIFRVLSVFAGGATVAGLAAVTEIEVTNVALLRSLDALVDQNLIYITRHGGSTRYAQLVTLRAYGMERLAESGEFDLARRRHAEYYALLAEEERPRVGHCEPESLALLGEEYENLRAALSWTLEVADAEAIWTGLRLAGAVWFWWEVRGLLVEGLSWLERLVVAAPEAKIDSARKVLVAVWSGVMALSYHLGRFERAYEAGEYALVLQRRLSDKHELASAYNNQAIVAAGVRRYEAAGAYFRESLELYAELGHPDEECKPLMNLGGVKRDLRQYAEALALYRESLRVAERTDEHDEARAILWDDIGDIHILLGEPVKALAALRNAEEIFQRLSAGLGVALCAHDLGRALISQGNWDEALRQLTRALTMREALGDVAGAARSQVHLARVHLAQADQQGTANFLANALHTLTALKRTEAMWTVIEGGAALACASGQFEHAARLYAAAIPQRDALWDIIDPQERERRACDLATIQKKLGEETYAAACGTGSTMTLDEALDLLRATQDWATQPHLRS